MQALFGQLLVGLINGSFYAMLSLGSPHLRPARRHQHRAGRLLYARRVHILDAAALGGIGYFWALILAPLAVGLVGAAIEKSLLSRVYKLDHMYGLLLTFGLMMFIQGTSSVSSRPPAVPIRCRPNSPGASIWVSCSCPGIAPGW